MYETNLRKALDIIDRAKGCLVCAAIADVNEVINSTLKILDEAEKIVEDTLFDDIMEEDYDN